MTVSGEALNSYHFAPRKLPHKMIHHGQEAHENDDVVFDDSPRRCVAITNHPAVHCVKYRVVGNQGVGRGADSPPAGGVVDQVVRDRRGGGKACLFSPVSRPSEPW